MAETKTKRRVVIDKLEKIAAELINDSKKQIKKKEVQEAYANGVLDFYNRLRGKNESQT